MTWHRLADHPFPVPAVGATLLIQLNERHEPLVFTRNERSGDWNTPGRGERAEQLRGWWISVYPDAQWFLVPAPEADDLVQRAVINAGRREATLRPRWSWLTEVFGVGSTRARELCRRFGLDPDEMVGGADAGEGDDS